MPDPILTLSNISLGIFSFYLLRAVDRKYTTLIGRSVTVLNDLQTQTAVAVDAMRSTNPDVIDVPAANRTEVIQLAYAAIGRDRESAGTNELSYRARGFRDVARKREGDARIERHAGVGVGRVAGEPGVVSPR